MLVLHENKQKINFTESNITKSKSLFGRDYPLACTAFSSNTSRPHTTPLSLLFLFEYHKYNFNSNFIILIFLVFKAFW